MDINYFNWCAGQRSTVYRHFNIFYRSNIKSLNRVFNFTIFVFKIIFSNTNSLSLLSSARAVSTEISKFSFSLDSCLNSNLLCKLYYKKQCSCVNFISVLFMLLKYSEKLYKQVLYELYN